jgi:hypothetical protein
MNAALCSQGSNVKYILILLTLLKSISVQAGDFSGSWKMDPIPNSTQTFDLHLSQSGKKVCGIHFGSAKGGAKIDSSFGSEASATVSGTVNNGVAEIIIISSQSDKPVEGIIMLQENMLVWSVTNPQTHRLITIPRRAELKSVPHVNLGFRSLDVLCSQ